MKHYSIGTIQFWIAEHEKYTEIHFDGTNERADIKLWPFTLRKRFKFGVARHVVDTVADNLVELGEALNALYSSNKKLVFTGFSLGCCYAYYMANSAVQWRRFTHAHDDVYCALDDPPRFLSKEYRQNDFPLIVWYKGRSIIHHLPPAWLGYKKHITENYMEIKSKAPWWDLRALITDHYKIKPPYMIDKSWVE